MSAKHTPGPWTVGARGGCVVSQSPLEGVPEGTGHCDVRYYGGYLIGESIFRAEDAFLIAAAPQLLDSLRDLLYLATHTNVPYDVQIDAVDRAKRVVFEATGESA